jgi:hypothetical protein
MSSKEMRIRPSGNPYRKPAQGTSGSSLRAVQDGGFSDLRDMPEPYLYTSITLRAYQPNLCDKSLPWRPSDVAYLGGYWHTREEAKIELREVYRRRPKPNTQIPSRDHFLVFGVAPLIEPGFGPRRPRTDSRRMVKVLDGPEPLEISFLPPERISDKICPSIEF